MSVTIIIHVPSCTWMGYVKCSTAGDNDNVCYFTQSLPQPHLTHTYTHMHTHVDVSYCANGHVLHISDKISIVYLVFSSEKVKRKTMHFFHKAHIESTQTQNEKSQIMPNLEPTQRINSDKAKPYHCSRNGTSRGTVSSNVQGKISFQYQMLG